MDLYESKLQNVSMYTYFSKSLAVLHVQSLLLQPVFSDGPETPSVEDHVNKVIHKNPGK